MQTIFFNIKATQFVLLFIFYIKNSENIFIIASYRNLIKNKSPKMYFSVLAADPKFTYPIANVTASVGRDAFLTCVVQDLGSYKVRFKTF